MSNPQLLLLKDIENRTGYTLSSILWHLGFVDVTPLARMTRYDFWGNEYPPVELSQDLIGCWSENNGVYAVVSADLDKDGRINPVTISYWIHKGTEIIVSSKNACEAFYVEYFLKALRLREDFYDVVTSNGDDIVEEIKYDAMGYPIIVYGKFRYGKGRPNGNIVKRLAEILSIPSHPPESFLQLY